MISASVRSPSTYETTAVTSSSTSSALRSWCPRTPRARAWWVRTALGPCSARRRFASVSVSPSGPVPSTASTVVASRVAAVARSVPEATQGATGTALTGSGRPVDLDITVDRAADGPRPRRRARSRGLLPALARVPGLPPPAASGRGGGPGYPAPLSSDGLRKPGVHRGDDGPGRSGPLALTAQDRSPCPRSRAPREASPDEWEGPVGSGRRRVHGPWCRDGSARPGGPRAVAAGRAVDTTARRGRGRPHPPAAGRDHPLERSPAACERLDRSGARGGRSVGADDWYRPGGGVCACRAPQVEPGAEPDGAGDDGRHGGLLSRPATTVAPSTAGQAEPEGPGCVPTSPIRAGAQPFEPTRGTACSASTL